MAAVTSTTLPMSCIWGYLDRLGTHLCPFICCLEGSRWAVARNQEDVELQRQPIGETALHRVAQALVRFALMAPRGSEDEFLERLCVPGLFEWPGGAPFIQRPGLLGNVFGRDELRTLSRATGSKCYSTVAGVNTHFLGNVFARATVNWKSLGAIGPSESVSPIVHGCSKNW